MTAWYCLHSNKRWLCFLNILWWIKVLVSTFIRLSKPGPDGLFWAFPDHLWCGYFPEISRHTSPSFGDVAPFCFLRLLFIYINSFSNCGLLGARSMLQRQRSVHLAVSPLIIGFAKCCVKVTREMKQVRKCRVQGSLPPARGASGIFSCVSFRKQSARGSQTMVHTPLGVPEPLSEERLFS